ncbi:hypothetical protein H6F77_26260 [Microcoleus sp. FACHB-831]|uniref:hypothetical protein n=1 Tax=Microcoleus sp. FACHB-831 TaxID=2692827 RepID=UPI0016850BCD|nr:hypothetical protein [Microcoleus sp. FACHB-831]MBD1924540.1 hypothetical protein [Microcoleus sp. FACHB-831]
MLGIYSAISLQHCPCSLRRLYYILPQSGSARVTYCTILKVLQLLKSCGCNTQPELAPRYIYPNLQEGDRLLIGSNPFDI